MIANLRYVLSLTIFLIGFSALAQQNYWQETNKNLSLNKGSEILNKKFYKTYQLDLNAFKSQLVGAPLRSSNINRSNVKVFLPSLKNGLQEFMIVETPVLSDELSALYPNIKTYLGFSTRNAGNRVRFSVTPQGLQTMTTYADNLMDFTVPLSKTDNTNYVVYDRRARLESIKDFDCLTEDTAMPIAKRTSTSRDANDQTLRTFRIAISTTGEYTNFWDDGNLANGNAQEDALAQVVSTLNRNNEVYEVDMAVTFKLVTGTEIIFPDATTDPYTSGGFNSQLQAELSAQVGEANYDIGHLFAFGSNNGNAGCIGCVCVDGNKGSAFSEHSFLDNDGGPYMSDFFDIDYVPHEIGHQMGANHTWSFSSEGTGVNAEPGSGTTIMGYAGITGLNDVQDHSDPYFHYYSILQILNNLQTQTCWVGTVISNSPPVADAGSDFTIPTGTAFVLKGSATDANSADILTYNWEQIDNGVTTSGNFGPNKATGAVWRSRPPSTSPDRFMPIIERVISGQLTEINPTETLDNSSWETVSNVGRTLEFALIVRDRSEANGVGQTPQSDFDTMTVTVDDAAGPFSVTSQTTDETWDVGSNQTIAWDVAGTDTGEVNTPTVNILLSIDGGFTYPFTLATNVPNDGLQEIVVPAVGGDSSTARVKVEGNGNIFYAINSSNFSIQESEFVLNIDESVVEVCAPDNAVFAFTYNTFLGFTGTTTFNTTGLPTGANAIFSPATASADETSVTLTISGIGTLSVGNYPFSIEGTSGTVSNSEEVALNVYDATIPNLNLIQPADGATDVDPIEATFSWNSEFNATSYDIDIATDAAFNNIIDGGSVNATNFIATSFSPLTQYYWRVRGVNDCGLGLYTEATFTTLNISCNNFSATDVPISILETDNNVDNYTSVITITEDLPILDIDVRINIQHAWDSDLDISLISPAGTVVELSSDNGGSGDNYTNTVFDQETTELITSGSPPFTGSFVPEGDLSILYGETSGGDWTLSVDDDFGTEDGGEILEFTMLFCVEGTLGIENFEVNTTDFSISPNPNNGVFNINLTNFNLQDVKVSVHDIRGRRIYEEIIEASTQISKSIDLRRNDAGVYLVTVEDGVRKITKRVIIN
ncbi:reprolysin-like metallopeptidase [uncultured Winogradskyella sp.]|uniref:zinc-dependent metalloprotease n=1 Tax=uncultured Winogradskyella sp. TaxID=395353 RepID=UPI00260D68B7|nr:zinc-dependent metalloprotease family protein [uncultured Winogradskyella sp.]